MSRVRVYELAKQLSISNKEVLDLLEEYGMPASNHMSTVDDNAAEFVIRRVKKKRTMPSSREATGFARTQGSGFSPSLSGFQNFAGRDDRSGRLGASGGGGSRGTRRRGGRLRQTDVI
ncbi:MAG: translation initiation factor IF-2 N-terminal domain-containing protein, partial [Bacillota bacterium]